MKRVLVAAFMVVAFAVAIMSGCASQKAMTPTYQTGSEGAAKQPMDMGAPAKAGTWPTGSEGAAKPGVDMGAPAKAGTWPTGGEGAAKPGVQPAQPK